MAEKSVVQEIIDTFINDLSKDPSIGKDIAESMKQLIEFGKYKKEDLAQQLKDGNKDEDSKS